MRLDSLGLGYGGLSRLWRYGCLRLAFCSRIGEGLGLRGLGRGGRLRPALRARAPSLLLLCRPHIRGERGFPPHLLYRQPSAARP
ncbi:MAG: hypothetical protein FWF69_07865, partial [Firmicutes bacterium]|nr:hypothetical protein [Bacillota bacterium]